MSDRWRAQVAAYPTTAIGTLLPDVRGRRKVGPRETSKGAPRPVETSQRNRVSENESYLRARTTRSRVEELQFRISSIHALYVSSAVDRRPGLRGVCQSDRWRVATPQLQIVLYALYTHAFI